MLKVHTNTRSHHTSVPCLCRNHNLLNSPIPLGRFNTQIEIAPGITKIEFESYAAYHLSEQRLTTFTHHFPNYTAGFFALPWFCQHVDWLLLPLAFQDAFSIKTLFHAYNKTFKSAHTFLSHLTEPFYQTPLGLQIQTLCEQYRASLPDEWYLKITPLQNCSSLLTFTHRHTNQTIEYVKHKPIPWHWTEVPHTTQQIKRIQQIKTPMLFPTLTNHLAEHP
jgi:hypothetical protein